MKILIIHNEYINPGGEDEVVRSEIELLKRHGHDVIVYWRENKELNSLSGFEKFLFLVKGVLWSKKTYTEIKQLIQENKPDVAHIHNTFYVITPSVYQACREEGIPIIQTLHNYRLLCPAATFFRSGKICEECLSSGRKQAVVHKCFKNSRVSSLLLVKVIDKFYEEKIISETIEKFIVLSEFSKSKFIGSGFNIDKFVVKPNFVKAISNKSETNGKYALYVGTLQPYKGIQTLLSAWQKLQTQLPLKIIGDGPLKGAVESAVRNQADIEYLGPKPLAESIQMIKGARFVVLPSECYENFPRVIVEAYACGVPVLVSNIGAMEEIVDDKRTGRLFEAGNADDCAQKIKELIENDPEVATMGQNAKDEFEKRYRDDLNYQQLVSIYESVLPAGVR